MRPMLTLGIETSCDETAAALVADASTIRSSIVATQFDVHARYGGIVPELACRRHLENILPVVRAALSEGGATLEEVELIAVTRGPGLIGSLLVGLNCAKALAYATATPCVGVNHLEGHLAAPLLEGAEYRYPLVALVVSGGHTELYRVAGPGRIALLGQTLDDAAGEAFDKVARFLDLGYPGGPAIDRAALDGDPGAIRFPRPMTKDPDNLDFSFSGLKTAVVNHVRKHPDVTSADVAASFQAAVVDVLVSKARKAARRVGATGIVLGGGVAANSLLREELLGGCADDGIGGFLPDRAMCTDNAAMIAATGWYRLASDGPTALDVGAQPNLKLPLIA